MGYRTLSMWTVCLQLSFHLFLFYWYSTLCLMLLNLYLIYVWILIYIFVYWSIHMTCRKCLQNMQKISIKLRSMDNVLHFLRSVYKGMSLYFCTQVSKFCQVRLQLSFHPSWNWAIRHDDMFSLKWRLRLLNVTVFARMGASWNRGVM